MDSLLLWLPSPSSLMEPFKDYGGQSLVRDFTIYWIKTAPATPGLVFMLIYMMTRKLADINYYSLFR